MGVGTTNSSSDTVVHGEPTNGTRLLGFDPLTLTMCTHDMLPSRDIMQDPMMEKFTASIIASWIVMCHPLASTSVATQLVDGATMVVTCDCCGQQTSQHAGFELHMLPPCSIRWAADSPSASTQQG